MDALVANKTLYFRAGQVRSMPYPATWTRCFGGRCPPPGTYQNGAYWATPLNYVASAMQSTGHTDFAVTVIAEAIADFQANGIYEDVDYGYPANARGVLNYTASVTNALLGAAIVGAHPKDIGTTPGL